MSGVDPLIRLGLLTAGLIVITTLATWIGKSRIGVFAGMAKRFTMVFKPHLLWLLVASAVFTFLWVEYRLDRKLITDFVRWFPNGNARFWSIFMIGYFWHAGIGLVLYFSGRLGKWPRLIAAGAAGLQALILNVWFVSTLKLLTGRLGPYRYSQGGFSFDFWNRVAGDGRFYWPSGHTAAAFAFVSAIVALYPRKWVIALLGFPLAFGTGVVMIAGHYHWVSDVPAGALIGHAVGWAVGSSMRQDLNETHSLSASKG